MQKVLTLNLLYLSALARRYNLGAALSVVLLTAAFGCGAHTYELPPPPAEAETATAVLNPAEEAELSDEHYQQSRRAILHAYEAAGQEQWDDLYDLLSMETRVLFDTFGQGAGGEAIGTGVFLVDGIPYYYDPTTLILPADPIGFADEAEGMEEFESAHRKDLFVTTATGAIVRLICIEEGERWLIHMPEIPMSQLSTQPLNQLE